MVWQQLVIHHFLVGPDEIEYGTNVLFVIVNTRDDRSSGDKGLVREGFISSPEICLDPKVVNTDPLLVAGRIAEFVVVQDDVGVFDNGAKKLPGYVARCLDRRVDSPPMCF